MDKVALATFSLYKYLIYLAPCQVLGNKLIHKMFFYELCFLFTIQTTTIIQIDQEIAKT